MSEGKEEGKKLFGSLETGGTKMCYAVVDEDGTIIEECETPTCPDPKDTFRPILAFFKKYPILSLGVASFGPIEVHEDSPHYGQILNTPKPGWKNVSQMQYLKDLKIPVAFDTDVNGSCIGEITYGAAKGLKNVVYITIGTGIGIGIYSEGSLVHGMLHPEGGHILLSVREDDPGKSVCPYHENCLEGLASGPSIQKRWGAPAKDLVDKDEVWDLEADYIAQAIVAYTMVLSPQKIIIGGGVMHLEKLFPLIRSKFAEKLNKYIETNELKDLDNFIVPNSLNEKQGILGAAKIGMDFYQRNGDKVSGACCTGCEII